MVYSLCVRIIIPDDSNSCGSGYMKLADEYKCHVDNSEVYICVLNTSWIADLNIYVSTSDSRCKY